MRINESHDSGYAKLTGDRKDCTMTVTLVLGGARSGKSEYAEGLLSALQPPWIYVATGQPLDSEMSERVRLHQSRRGQNWITIEEPLGLAASLARADIAERPMLIDCLTLWASNLMHAGLDVDASCQAVASALQKRPGPTVLVSNEVGLGIVPDNALARRFRDEAGRINQRIAAVADKVILVVAGLPLTVK